MVTNIKRKVIILYYGLIDSMIIILFLVPNIVNNDEHEI